MDFEIAAEAGEIDLDMKKKVKNWGLADSMILCTARVAQASVITGDEHFRELDETVFIKEKTQ